MLRSPQGWFKRRSFSGSRPDVKMPATDEHGFSHKRSIYEDAVAWENSRQEALEKSEARAWSMVRWSSVLAVLAMAALVILAPFYKIVPLTFEVDKLTGQAQLVDLSGPMPMTSTEAMDKHWVADYVRTRERFVWTLLQLDYDHTMNLSDERVAREYRPPMSV